MFDLSKMTLPEVISALKDAGFLIGMVFGPIVFGWKGRSWVQPIVDFFKEAKEFMKESKLHQQTMEHNMTLLMTNHMAHIEADLKTLSGRTTE